MVYGIENIKDSMVAGSVFGAYFGLICGSLFERYNSAFWVRQTSVAAISLLTGYVDSSDNLRFAPLTFSAAIGLNLSIWYIERVSRKDRIDAQRRLEEIFE